MEQLKLERITMDLFFWCDAHIESLKLAVDSITMDITFWLCISMLKLPVKNISRISMTLSLPVSLVLSHNLHPLKVTGELGDQSILSYCTIYDLKTISTSFLTDDLVAELQRGISDATFQPELLCILQHGSWMSLSTKLSFCSNSPYVTKWLNSYSCY